MKKVKFIALLLLPLFAKSQVCVVNLDIDTVKAKKAYLIYQLDGKSMIDSPDIKNGKASFRANIPYPIHAEISLDDKGYGYANGQKPDLLRFYLEPGKIDIKTKRYVREAMITGSVLNRELLAYNKFISEPINLLEDANYVFMVGGEAYRNDTANQRKFNQQMRKGVDWMKDLQEQWIKAHPNSFCSLDALQSIAGSNMNVNKVDSLYKLLSPAIRNTVDGKAFAKRITAAHNTTIGSVAPDFTQNDVDDKPVKLSDFRGKYVLIDFWASWCGPCRAENPNYVKAFNQYKNNNFTILGVSLDREGQKEAWVKAINKDGLTWPQVSDLQYWDNEVAKMYEVRAVPANYLIDPRGVIIAKNLRGENLQGKLAELFADSSFVIKGNVPGEQEDRKIYLRYNQHFDSTILRNGRFEFKGALTRPAFANLWGEDKEKMNFGSNVQFYIEPGVITITGMNSLDGSVVSGGQTQSEQLLLDKILQPLGAKTSELYLRKEKNANNPDSLQAIGRETEQLSALYKEAQLNFIKRFPDSYVSYAQMESQSFLIDPTVLEPMFNSLSDRLKSSEEAKEIARRLDIAKRTWIGQPALDFTQNDVNGKPVSLKSFRGKYVMIDFWASWCGWCRIEHPTLIKAYNKYKDKGFTLLSVSLDDAKEKDKWLAAIKKDGLPWQQVSDLKGRDNAVARLYGIKGIPQSVIVGPDGIIVAKNLRGEALLDKLQEIFGN